VKTSSNVIRAAQVALSRSLRLTLLLPGLVLLAGLSFPVFTFSQKLNDLYFRLRPPQVASTRVALVLIDDASLARYGRWPWQRARLAQLLTAVSSQHPRALGLDILLSEPEDEANDAALAQAIHSAPNAVLASKISGGLDTNHWIDPLPRFAQAAKGIGHVQAIVDSDGICRRIPAEEPSIDGPRPAFALKLASLVGAPQSAEPALPDQAVQQITLRPFLIDYRQQSAEDQQHPPFVTVSASDLLAGKRFPQLAGKAVLIGFGSVELSDRLVTPVSTQLPMPGVEINANAVETALAGEQLQELGLLWQLLLLVVASSLSLWLVIRFPGVKALLGLAAILFAGYFGAFLVFVHLHRLLSYGPILLSGVLAAPLAQLENLLMVDREVSERLRQLRHTIRPGAEGPPHSSGRLHWKLSALHELQTELSSLYSFQSALLETMREGVAVYSEDGGLRFGNASWKSFCARQGAEPGSLSGLAMITTAWPELAMVAQMGGTWVETELPLGEGLWHFYAVPLSWTSLAEAGAVMLIAEDISARRERDQARSEALSFVTHELRTPLIAIQGFSELLMRYPGSPASTDAPATIFRESNRLVAMINTYLEVLRLDAGARPLRRIRASVPRMVEHVEKVVRPLAAAAKIEVKSHIACAEEHLVCDEPLISGALLNLVSNAIKYGSSGTQVGIRVSSEEEEVRFEVHNSGPAIPEADLKHVFERFYRPSRSESIPGWGLGLSFVRRICQQHGGSVQVNSDEISGTSFTFTLPRGAPKTTEVAP
jgi:signal transduction histidine kinase/CHASE2 domain-containing sensor protein